MSLLYTTDFRKSTVRGALVVAPAALALMVMLLWFGSIRNPDPLSAEKANRECILTGGLSFHCSMTGSDPAAAMQGTERGEPSGVQSPGISIDSGEGQNNQRCLLPGIPCTLDPGNPAPGQPEGVQVLQEMRTY